MTKVLFSADEAWLLRSTKTSASRAEVSVWFYETPAVWNRSPALATIFRSYEAASAHMVMMHERDRAPKGWADGSTEVFDIVTLRAEIMALQKAAR